MKLLRYCFYIVEFCILLSSCTRENPRTAIEKVKETSTSGMKIVTDNIEDTYNIIYKRLQGRISEVPDSIEYRLLWRIMGNKFSKKNSLEINISNSREAMIDTLSTMLVSSIEEGVTEIIDLRCGIWSIPRIFYQTLFVSDKARRHDWAVAIKERISNDNLETMVNSQIEEFNMQNPKNTLNCISLSEITESDIIDDLAFERIKGREWFEWAGVIIDILITAILGYVIGFIIGFIIGFCFGGISVVAANIIGIVVSAISFIVSLFMLAPKYAIYESGIVDAILNNYMDYLSTQYVIEQMLSL